MHLHHRRWVQASIRATDGCKNEIQKNGLLEPAVKAIGLPYLFIGDRVVAVRYPSMAWWTQSNFYAFSVLQSAVIQSPLHLQVQRRSIELWHVLDFATAEGQFPAIKVAVVPCQADQAAPAKLVLWAQPVTRQIKSVKTSQTIRWRKQKMLAG